MVRFPLNAINWARLQSQRMPHNGLFSMKQKSSAASLSESRFQIFSDYFGMQDHAAKQYIESQRLSTVAPKALLNTIMFCESLGYDKDDLLENPILLRSSAVKLENHYNVMREGGFENIKANTLSKFRTLCGKPVLTLKTLCLIDPSKNVASCFIKHLDPCPTDFEISIKSSETWAEIHFKIMTEYLKWRLKASDGEIKQLVKTHPGVRRKSFTLLCENIKMAEDLGFTPDKILKYGCILHSYPKYTKEVLERHPFLAGTSVKKAMRMYPKLIMVSPSNIEEIYDILKEYNISDEAIQRRLNIFYLSPETVRFRLKELESQTHLKVFLNNPNILKLVVHHTRMKSRLSFLKELHLECASTSVLGNVESIFKGHLKNGKDCNTYSDLYALLKNIFHVKRSICVDKLRKHPYCLQVPLASIEHTYQYLKIEGFSKDSIFKAIFILFYPKDKIKYAFCMITDLEKKRNQTLGEASKLNLAIYFIEKEHHFNGDGIWTTLESEQQQL